MCSTKRVQLVVLFLIAAAFLAVTSAPAVAAPNSNGKLSRVPGSDERHASGQAVLGVLTFDRVTGPWGDDQLVWYTANLSLSCRGLTPGATYIVVSDWVDKSVWWSFTASARGSGNAEGPVWVYYYIPVKTSIPASFYPVVVRVYRDDGTGLGTLVLEGWVSP
jgi:hypothetical protein